MKKLTYNHIKSKIEDAGYKLLSDKYINIKTKIQVQCPKGHKYMVTYGDFKRGRRCPDCDISKKKTIKEVKTYIEKEGYKLLSNTYKNSITKLHIICPKGHEFLMRWASFNNGHRCPECKGVRKKTIEEIKQYAIDNNYECLSNKYLRISKKLKFKCPNGHIIKMICNDFLNGHRCIECCKTKKKTIEEVREAFKKEGYKLLSKTYKNATIKLKFICNNNHTYQITWSDFQNGKRCKYCYLENNRGKNHPNWNKNLTFEDRVINRKYNDYYEWRKEVYKRDNYTCQICKDNKGGNLVAHHLDGYNYNIKKRTELNNGITLCEKCHMNFHHIYGYGNNTKKQFEEYIKELDKNGKCYKNI